MSVTDIVYRINADSTRFSREMRFAAKDMRRLERRASSSFRKIGRAAGIMGGAVVTAFGAMIKRQVDNAAEMDELASKASTTTEELSQFKHVAEENDVAFQTLQGRLQRLNREMSDAAREAEGTTTAFDEFGIQLRDDEQNMRSNTDVFRDIADAVANAGDEFEQTAIATEFFGNRAGQELMPILKDGADGIERLQARADELGVTISDDFGRQAQEYQANLRTMRNQGRRLAMNVGSQIIPAINDFMGVINDVDTSDARGDIDEMEDQMSSLEDAARKAAAGVMAVATGAEILGAEVGGAAGNLATWTQNTFQMWTDGDSFRGAARNELPLVGTVQDWVMDDEQIEDAESAYAQMQHRRMGGHNLGEAAAEIWERRAEDIRQILDGDMADGTPDEEDVPAPAPDIAEESDEDGTSDTYQQHLDERRSAAQRWKDETRTIFEEHRSDFDELGDLYDDGFIDEETFERGSDVLGERIEEHFGGAISSWEDGTEELEEQHSQAVDELADAYADGLIGDEVFADTLDMLNQEVNEKIGEVERRQEEAEARRMEELEGRAERVRAQLGGVDLQLQRQLENLEELRAEGVITFREYEQAVEMARESTEGLEESTKEVTTLAERGFSRLGNMVIDELVNPFGKGAAEMEQTFGERLEGMVRSFSQAMARMALEQALQGAVSAAFGGGGFSSGGQVQAFASGGFVSGPGTSTSDSIPAALSDGEFVMQADAVNRFGTGFMRSVNDGQIPAFAEGGQVGTSSRGGGNGGGAPSVSVFIVHSEEEVADMMSGAAGEEVVIAHMQSNSGQIA